VEKVKEQAVKNQNNPLQKDNSYPALLSNFYLQIPERIPIERPTVDLHFTEQHFLNRSVESIQYCLLNFEYSLSPSGRLRQWIKLNLLLFLWIGIPVFMLLPVVTVFFSEFSTLSGYFNEIVNNLFQSCCCRDWIWFWRDWFWLELFEEFWVGGSFELEHAVRNRVKNANNTLFLKSIL